MTYHATITADKIRTNLQERIAEYKAELQALKGVKIDTKHKTLTNRAISGDGARIGDYIGIGKALYISYKVTRADGGTKYMSRDITAYSYEGLDGKEIGVDGFTRISRTITPAELQAILTSIIEALERNLKELQSEYKRAESIANKHNKLVEQLKAFNNSVSYASEAQI